MQQPNTNQRLVVSMLSDGASHALKEADMALWKAEEYFEAARQRLEAVAAAEIAECARTMLDGLRAIRTTLDLAATAAGVTSPPEVDERFGWDVTEAAIMTADKALVAVEAPRAIQ